MVKAIEQRVSVMDYALNELPGERKLAEEFGVSHMTARKAVQHLLEKGVLTRTERGTRVTRRDRQGKDHLSIAFVMPAIETASLSAWYKALNNVVGSRNGVVRAVTYVHDADRALNDALRGDLTGLFIVPPHQMSPLLLSSMTKHRNRVVTLWHDYTDVGIPCVEVAPPRFMKRVVEYLAGLGHTVIDCLTTEPTNTVSTARIQVWQAAIQELGLRGQLHNRPVEPFERPDLAAYEYMRGLAGKPLEATALICVSTAAAVGVSRACYETGIRLGHDLSVCGWGGMAEAKLSTPSLTVLQPASFEEYLALGLDWIVSEGKSGGGNLHLEPEDVSVWVGESTGPARR